MKRITKNLIEMIHMFFLTLIVQLCSNRTKNIFHTNCIALHMTPNMANITQLHGYMKMKRLKLESDIIYICIYIYMDP